MKQLSFPFTVIAVLIIGLLTCINISCQQQQRKENKEKKVFNSDAVLDAPSQNKNYGSIFKGLSLSYVENVHSKGEYQDNILSFYKKTQEEFVHDSIEYALSVAAFFQADEGIINYLLSFANDTSEGDWLRPTHPYSSTLGVFDTYGRRKNTAALILLHNYLNPSQNRRIYIPSIVDTLHSTSTLDLPVTRIGLMIPDHESIRSWYSQYSSLSVQELRATYKQKPPKFVVLY